MVVLRYSMRNIISYLDTHLDFIKSGAEVIVTTTFTTRKIRLKDNNVEDKYEYLNIKAGEIAQKAKKQYPKTLIAGGLPPIYEADTRSEKEIEDNFYSQAKLLNPYIDFFYFDVLSSVREFKIAIESIKEFNKPYLIGAHIRVQIYLVVKKFYCLLIQNQIIHPNKFLIGGC